MHNAHQFKAGLEIRHFEKNSNSRNVSEMTSWSGFLPVHANLWIKLFAVLVTTLTVHHTICYGHSCASLLMFSLCVKSMYTGMLPCVLVTLHTQKQCFWYVALCSWLCQLVWVVHSFNSQKRLMPLLGKVSSVLDSQQEGNTRFNLLTSDSVQ